MTELFILAVAVMAAVILARGLLALWTPAEDDGSDAET